jgi:hypothetical protein
MLEPYLRLELDAINPEASAASFESILHSLLKLPPLMQLHWSTRLDIMNHLTRLCTELAMHLNAQGQLIRVGAGLKDKCDALIKAGSSPAQISCGLLCRTSLELAMSEVRKDSRFTAWAQELMEPLGKYDQSEEVESAVLLCLKKIHTVRPVLDSSMLKTSTVWLSVLSAIIANETGLTFNSDDQLLRSLASSQIEFSVDVLRVLSTKPKLTPADIRVAQASIIFASKLSQPSEELLDICIALHPALLMGEPAELKNLTSIHISRLAINLATDVAEVWLKYLIGKLEKPAPAIVKSDAAIALAELLFGGVEDTITDRVPSSFFNKILPTLVSSTTDSRVNSWYINLLACRFGSRRGPSFPTEVVSESRFGKDWAFGQLISSLASAKNPVKIGNQLMTLTCLKLLPRLDWDQLLSRFDIDISMAFISEHVVAKLHTGGIFISPSLLKMLKDNLLIISTASRSRLLTKLVDILPFVEQSDHELIVKSLLGSASGTAMLPTFELFSCLYPSLLEKPLFFDQLAVEVLSDSSRVSRKVYCLACSILDVEKPSIICSFLQLVRLSEARDWDMRRIICLVRASVVYPCGFLEAVVEELAIVPAEHRTDLLVKILELALVDTDLENTLYYLFIGLIFRWLEPVHNALFQRDKDFFVGIAWRCYEEMNVEVKDWRKFSKRFAQLGNRWDHF